MVANRVRLREAAPQFWIWTFVIFLAFGVIYWQVAARQLQSQKSAVMARQRAVAQELAPRIHPLRDKVEAWVSELAADWAGNTIATEFDIDSVRGSKGLYLRLLREEAGSSKQIQAAAETSLHDGFTSCMFTANQRPVHRGERCYRTSNCESGQICNDWNVCAEPTQPFNLRLMYQSLRVLSPEWTDELHQTTTDKQVRLFELDLDKVTKSDVPIALSLAASAKYFTAVLDEIPEAERSTTTLSADAGAGEVRALRLQGVSHYVRVGVWNIASDQRLFQARIYAGAKVVPMGPMKTAPSRTLKAQQRQVNNCSIAQEVRALAAAAENLATESADKD